MYIKPPQSTQLPTTLPNNPTDEQRHEMLRQSLIKAGRPEDYEVIVSTIGPPTDVTCYVNPGEFRNLKVGIIGGGLAGMAAAFELRKLGYDITIFEPNTKWIGGRVYTYYFDSEKKLYGELGAMRIPVSHETTWHYINLFKLNTEPFVNIDHNTFIYVRGTRIRNDPKGENVAHSIYPKFGLSIELLNTPWPELYNQVARYYLSTMPPEVRKEFLMIMPKYDYRHEALQNITLHQAMEQYGLSIEAINLISSVMPTVGSLLNESYEASLHSDYTMDFDNLYRISGGMGNLPVAFYKSLTSPAPTEYPDISQDALGRFTWKGGFVVNGIMKAKDGKVTLRYRRDGLFEDIYEDFDYVVCALPFPMLRQADISPNFSVRKMQAIRDVYYQDAQKTLFLCRERFWEKQGIYGGASYTDEIIETIIYPQDHIHCGQQGTASCSPDEPGVITASYNIGEDAFDLGNYDPISQYQVIRSKVEKVHGLPRWYLHNNNIVQGIKTIDWVREPWSAGAFQMYLPEQRGEYLYVSSTPEYDNRVFFCGEHTTNKNGWIQGALWSGMRAAGNIAYHSVIHKYQQ